MLLLLLLIRYLLILAIHFFHLVLEIFNHIINICLGLTNTLRIIFNQLNHYFHHIRFAFAIIEVVMCQNFDQTFVVIVFLLQIDHFHEVVFS